MNNNNSKLLVPSDSAAFLMDADISWQEVDYKAQLMLLIL